MFTSVDIMGVMGRAKGEKNRKIQRGIWQVETWSIKE